MSATKPIRRIVRIEYMPVALDMIQKEIKAKNTMLFHENHLVEEETEVLYFPAYKKISLKKIYDSYCRLIDEEYFENDNLVMSSRVYYAEKTITSPLDNLGRRLIYDLSVPEPKSNYDSQPQDRVDRQNEIEIKNEKEGNTFNENGDIIREVTIKSLENLKYVKERIIEYYP
jgi:hypothetical protein